MSDRLTHVSAVWFDIRHENSDHEVLHFWFPEQRWKDFPLAYFL